MGIAAGLPEGGHVLTVRDEGRTTNDETDTSSFVIRPTDAPISSGYDVLIADELLHQAGHRILAAGLKPGRCAVVTNPTVGGHHLPALVAALTEAGFEPVVFQVPDGEAYKTLATVGDLYDRFAEARLARSEPVIALGGGVIGDMAGFVAATWLRGVPFVQIPTSLLSMVDASVGGKVAVDLPAGKNLVGAFKQPELVLIDPALLSTLPVGEFRSGLAEVLKAGIINDPALFERLAGGRTRDERRERIERRTTSDLVGMIADAVRVKARIVERDPYEMGDRAWLNLGHTFGHALELLSSYTLRHGDAVALGMIAAAEMSAALGYCDADLPPRIARRHRAAGSADPPRVRPGRGVGRDGHRQEAPRSVAAVRAHPARSARCLWRTMCRKRKSWQLCARSVDKRHPIEYDPRMKTIRWHHDKNEKLKRERHVSFEEVVYHIEQGDIVDITLHPNQEKYPGQQMYIIRLRGYLHLVPFVETEDEIFLKTIIPSRKAEREYRHV